MSDGEIEAVLITQAPIDFDQRQQEVEEEERENQNQNQNQIQLPQVKEGTVLCSLFLEQN